MKIFQGSEYAEWENSFQSPGEGKKGTAIQGQWDGVASEVGGKPGVSAQRSRKRKGESPAVQNDAQGLIGSLVTSKARQQFYGGDWTGLGGLRKEWEVRKCKRSLRKFWVKRSKIYGATERHVELRFCLKKTKPSHTWALSKKVSCQSSLAPLYTTSLTVHITSPTG